MTLYNKIIHAIKWHIGFVPVLSRLVFKGADAIIADQIKDGALDLMNQSTPAQRGMMHFSYGRFIRNKYYLWHPANPHTAKRLKKLSPEQEAASPYHPDNYSWGIITRIIVEAEKHGYVSKASRDNDNYERLVFSLLVNPEDDEETLDAIFDTITALVKAKRYDLVDSVLEEAYTLDVTTAKAMEIMNGIAGCEDYLTDGGIIRLCMLTVSRREIKQHDSVIQ